MTLESRLANFRYERALDRWIAAHGYVNSDMAIAAANDCLAQGDPEVAMLFCAAARELVKAKEDYIRQRMQRKKCAAATHRAQPRAVSAETARLVLPLRSES